MRLNHAVLVEQRQFPFDFENAWAARVGFRSILMHDAQIDG